MSSHLLEEDEEHGSRSERELTLSTGTILLVFFSLVLLCGLFFGFGYNMGRKSAATAIADANEGGASGSGANFNAFKPSAGSPVGSSLAGPAVKPGETNVVAPPPVRQPGVTSAAPTSAPPRGETGETVAPPPPRTTPAAPAHAAPVAMPPISSSGTFVVQVAAVSHQEDAELLVGALKGKGYAVTARSEPNDRFIHIQVGPFSTRKDADAMRQRLIADGYNALIK